MIYIHGVKLRLIVVFIEWIYFDIHLDAVIKYSGPIVSVQYKSIRIYSMAVRLFNFGKPLLLLLDCHMQDRILV